MSTSEPKPQTGMLKVTVLFVAAVFAAAVTAHFALRMMAGEPMQQAIAGERADPAYTGTASGRPHALPEQKIIDMSVVFSHAE